MGFRPMVLTGTTIRRAALGKISCQSRLLIFRMIFSRSAAKQMADFCSCPSADSPDDMIIGIFVVGGEIEV